MINTGDELFTWGKNSKGQLGLGDLKRRNYPEKINLQNFTNVSCGIDISCAIVSNQVFAWGSNKRKPFEPFEAEGRYLASPTNLGVENAKLVKCDPYQVLTFMNDDMTKLNINWLESAVFFSLIMTHKNELYAYGGNWEGQLGFGDYKSIDTPEKIKIQNVLSAKCGSDNTLILTNTLEVYSCGNNCWGKLGLGDNNSRITYTRLKLSNIVSIDSGFCHCMAMKKTNEIYVWGNNDMGRLGLGDCVNRYKPTKLLLSGVVTFKCSYIHSIVHTKDDKYQIFGKDSEQLTNIINEFNYSLKNKLM